MVQEHFRPLPTPKGDGRSTKIPKNIERLQGGGHSSMGNGREVSKALLLRCRWLPRRDDERVRLPPVTAPRTFHRVLADGVCSSGSAHRHGRGGYHLSAVSLYYCTAVVFSEFLSIGWLRHGLTVRIHTVLHVLQIIKRT